MQSIAKLSLPVSGVLMLLVLPVGCMTTRSTGTTGDVCLIWKPITYSAKSDSADTVEEVRNQNARREAYCAG